MNPEEVVDRANRFVAEGANVIYLMTTGNYDFDRFLEVAETVRASIPGEVPLVANTYDLGLNEARWLLKAGLQGAYHVVRMGEGRDTGIPPERRLAIMRAILQAGLRSAYCVEPIGPEHTVEEIVEKTFIGKEYGVWFSGAMRRIPVACSPPSLSPLPAARGHGYRQSEGERLIVFSTFLSKLSAKLTYMPMSVRWCIASELIKHICQECIIFAPTG